MVKKINIKLIIITVLALVFLQLGYSITFNEILSSYNFTFITGDIQIKNITLQQIDTNNNSLYDNLIINLNTQNTYGEYKTIATLTSKTSQIQTTKTNYLYNGINTISITIPSYSIDSDNYTLSLKIYKNNNLVYLDDNIKTIQINQSQYEKKQIKITNLEIQLQDTNNNSVYNNLKITYNLTIPEQNEYQILTTLTNENQSLTNYTTQYETIKQITAIFTSDELKENNIIPANLYAITIKNETYRYTIYTNEPISFSLKNLDLSQSYISNQITETTTNSNNNNLYDDLILNIPVQIKQLGKYKLTITLKDKNNKHLLKQTQSYDIQTTNNQTLSFSIKGSDIYKTHLEGPYKISSIVLQKEDKMIDAINPNYFTQNYSYTNFEKPLMPDLTISKLNYTNSTNQTNYINLTLTNKGNVGAFGIIFKIFDNNLNILYQKLIEYILPNQNLTLTIQTPDNITSFYAYIDYENTIEETDEQNNIRIWPTPNEICDDKIDNNYDGQIDENCMPNTKYETEFWKRDWYNMYLNESLNITDNLSNITFFIDWQKNLVNNISKNRIGLNMTRSIYFENGTYVFEIQSDDGAKLYIDDNSTIDNWDNSKRNKKIYSNLTYLSEGYHDFKILYYENSGKAKLGFNFTKGCPQNIEPLNNTWNTIWCDSDNLRILSNKTISQNFTFKKYWEKGLVQDIRKNHIIFKSATKRYFENNTYIFGLQSDDSSILYIDGNLTINCTKKCKTSKYSKEINLSGLHTFEIEYLEKLGKAYISFDVFKTCPQNITDLEYNKWHRVFCDSKTNRVIKEDYDDSFAFEYDWAKNLVYGIQKNNLLVKYAGIFSLDKGSYIFELNSDDHSDLFIDGNLILNESKKIKSSDVINLSKGNHTFFIDYIEKKGKAKINFNYVILNDILDNKNDVKSEYLNDTQIEINESDFSFDANLTLETNDTFPNLTENISNKNESLDFQ